MDLQLGKTELLLQENRPLGLVNGRGVTVRCLAGTVWLTVEGEAGDCFLAPGQAHRLESDGLALIEPMGTQATIRLEPAPPGILARLARQLSRRPPPAADQAVAAVAGAVRTDSPLRASRLTCMTCSRDTFGR